MNSTFKSSLLEQIYEVQSQQKFDQSKAFDFTRKAFQHKEIHVVELISESFPKIVTEVIELDKIDLNLILESSTLIFQLKEYLSAEDRKFLLQKIIPRLIKHAEKIYNTINRSKYPNVQSYSPGNEWDTERTIENFLCSGDSYFSYKHVICSTRYEKQKNVILIIDKSHSVLLYLKWIILTSILFCRSMKLKDISLIVFDTSTELLKSFNDISINVDSLTNRLVNLGSGGKTNIYSALELANSEFLKRISPHKSLVMISDLLATSGADFLPLLKRIEHVKIILTPRRQTLQLTKPILGELRRMANVKIHLMPTDEKDIPKMLEQVLYDY
ncbi:VWA domain-containing protein [Candidatus Hodarchaeum mangrovi]